MLWTNLCNYAGSVAPGAGHLIYFWRTDFSPFGRRTCCAGHPIDSGPAVDSVNCGLCSRVALCPGGAFRFIGLLLLSVSFVCGYSVLTHEAIVDSVWDGSIQKMLLKRFPMATPAELEQAH